MIFSSKFNLLPRPRLYRFMACLPVLIAPIIFISPVVGIVGIILSFLGNMAVHYSNERAMLVQSNVIRYFSSIISCSRKLIKINGFNNLEVAEQVKKGYTVFKSVTNMAPEGKTNAGSFAEAFYTYFDIMFLISIRGYNNFMSKLSQENEAFHSLYQSLGEIDLVICVMSFRQSLPKYCFPDFHRENKIIFKEIFHPLLSSPITNSGVMENSSLITGSNASGKSTFIKTLAINGILAQTIFTCTAQEFASRISIIATSMVMQDDLQGGDGYFMVEIKSLKRVLDLVSRYPCTCYVDEILRGTNTIERIAASASVLGHLYNQDCLCIAASHDIEQTRILEYDNYHFREQVTDKEIVFDYKLNPGPSSTRNAIKLLGFMEFGDEIINKAERLYKDYVSNKTWE